MDYSEVIEKIMPLVESGDDSTHFVISKKEGEWNVDFISLLPNITFLPNIASEQLADAREQDPCALQFTGADFSGGSYPFVFDEVMKQRLNLEYENREQGNVALLTLLEFMEDNFAELSSEAAGYLTRLEAPLSTLRNICPFNLTDGIDNGKAKRMLSQIEYVASTWTRAEKAPDQDEASTVNPSEYSELNRTQIGGFLITLSEKPDAADRYMVCEYRWDNPFGALQSKYVGVTPDFLEALSEYIKHVQHYVGCVQSERDLRQSMDGVEHSILTAADCIDGAMDGDINGKIVIINPDALSPEYHRSDHQLKLVQGGFGASAQSRGNAVFCQDLYSGKESRFERYDILGVADDAKLPRWAKEKLAIIHNPALDEKKAERTDVTTDTLKKESIFKRMERLKEEHPQAATPAKEKKTPKQEL